MDAREAAINRLPTLWSDGGSAVLTSAGFASWRDVVGPMPEALFLVGDGTRETITILVKLREVFRRANRPRVALAFGRGVVDRASALIADDPVFVFTQVGALGRLLDGLGRHDEAGELLERAWRGLSSVLGEELAVANAAQSLGKNLRNRGDLAAASARIGEALAIRRLKTPGKIGALMAQRAELILELEGDESAADPLYEAWKCLVNERGATAPFTIGRARLAAPVLHRVGRSHDAVEIFETIESWVREQGDPARLASFAFEFGRSLDAIGKEERSTRLVDESLRITKMIGEAQGGAMAELPQRLSTWALMQERRGRRNQAEGFMLEALEVETLLYGPTSTQVGLRQFVLGDLTYRAGRLDAAIGWIDSGLGLLRSSLGDEHELAALVAERLVDLLLEKADECIDELNDPDTGWEYIYRGRAITLDILGPDHPAHRTLKYYRSKAN